MTIRPIVAAALMACTFAAQADVIPTSTGNTSAGFLSGWTTGSGASVIGSGVLSGNVNLIGGIAYGADSTSTSGGAMADALIDKASSSLGKAGGKTELFYSKGIEGVYLLGKGHGVLAAMLGDGVSVVGSNKGVIVSQGNTGAQAGNGTGGGNTGGGNGSEGGSNAGGATGAGADGGLAIGGGNDTAGGGNAGGATGGNAGGDTAILIGQFPNDAAGDNATIPPARVLPLEVQQPAAAVPEPSTIALMLAGVLGAGVLKRRRAR
jgi:hypothetical protein